jgi:hypothetical protein
LAQTKYIYKENKKMWGKIKDNKKATDLIIKAITIMIIVVVALLSLDVMTSSRDGRRQIVDENGGTEAALSAILQDMKGVGEVDVMITYENGNTITGVIVTAEGAGNVVVRNNITSAVAGVFNLPVKNVMVFEKENGGANK